MMAELLALTLLRTQAAAAAAVLLVLLLRGPMRAAFGAGLAYRLWALVPVAAIATVFPSLSETLGSGAPPPLMGEERAVMVMAVWLAGCVALATVILLQERAFRARAQAGRAGPAVMGVFWPRVVLPADFAARFDEQARKIVDLHERAHIKRGDPVANLAIAAIQVLGWCNPLIHVGALCARLDQEMACDASVLSLRPNLRRTYAQALVEAHTRRTGSPLACFFAAHPLLLRVKLLARPEPSYRRQTAGAAAIALMAVITALGVWTVTPRGPLPSQEISWPGRFVGDSPVDGITLPKLNH
ncbi:peptidase M56 [Caulobacter sp. Root487D2Y]|uniref:M56 family metallopeptidase n=1 Tax=Caulobacter sp. Root487D2Y TaxID=1736547 RepID=UPI0006F39C2E|nr:M56 family metallopeptidase [Caulobacter sp. Root487D2Y]KQY27707.1 peptidase M56 [Caulobacter sp. Root487D2Y]